MTVIELPDDLAAALKAKAAAQGRDLEGWLQTLAFDRQETVASPHKLSVVEEMNALRARVKPDPEGWTTRDYVRYGRR